MAEYINREAFAEDIRLRYCKDCTTSYNGVRCRACWVDDMLGEVEDAPTADAVEVVRCKGCVWRIEIPNGTEFKGIKPRYCGLKQELTGESDYCSKGAKMDGKGEGE